MTKPMLPPQPPSPPRLSIVSPAPHPLAQVGPRAWMAVAGIAAVGAVIGGGMGRGWHQSQFVMWLIVALVLTSSVRAGWRVLRGGRAAGHVRRRTRSMVQQLGGGAYGVVGLATWLYLEAQTLAEDLGKATGVMDFIEQKSFSWLIGFSVDSVLNAVWAGIWPVYWFMDHPVAIGLVFALVWGASWMDRAASARSGAAPEVDALHPAAPAA
ncbi:MAG TPA: hypothetical protein VEY93_02545 [Longimicrobium sp.]|nr:hypothetical protein [Longimicrobium sp.]